MGKIYSVQIISLVVGIMVGYEIDKDQLIIREIGDYKVHTNMVLALPNLII